MQNKILESQYMSAKEAGEKWCISQRRVSTLCSENRIEGCIRVSNVWLIPSYTAKPQDARLEPKKKKASNTIKPFVKWAGGKSRLLSEIAKYYPHALGKSITKYVEPFVGGGAVLFDVLSKFDLEEVIINDINIDLMNLYRTIKFNVYELIQLLESFQEEYFASSLEERKLIYGARRDRFNGILFDGQSLHIEKAALFVFLNKTCFNGLYRVNKKGVFNVPIGAYKNPCICDKENLVKVSNALQKVTITQGSYSALDQHIDEHSFVYIDPPYRPLNATSNFTSYTEYSFDDNDQKALASFALQLKEKGAKILLSNSDPKNIDENDNFFEDIYKDFTIHRVYATRMINSKSSARGKITELLIINNNFSS